MDDTNKILVIGSAPDATQAADWDLSIFKKIVVINNAWRVIDGWDEHIYPYDFPKKNLPKSQNQNQYSVTEDAFVPAQNLLGGFVYAGATMVFTAGYWCLASHTPSLICFVGCNMHYPRGGQTHFYGTGTPDPLRDDISLTSLTACSRRLLSLGMRQNCEIVSLSLGPGELKIPKISFDDVSSYKSKLSLNTQIVERALNMEKKLGYYFEDGRYWNHLEAIDKEQLKDLDKLWINSVKSNAEKPSTCGGDLGL